MTNLVDRLDSKRKEYHENLVNLPEYAFTVKLPSVSITSAELIESNFFPDSYTVKMRFDELDASIFWTSDKEPRRLCSLLMGRSLTDLEADVFVDVEGYFFRITNKYIKDSLK